MINLVGVVPTWVARAACARPGVDPELFFPGSGQNNQDDTREVRRFCAHCDVQSPCADYALTNRIEHGIWGGLTERARRKMLRGRGAGARRRTTHKGTCKRCGDTADSSRSEFCGDTCREAHRREYNREYQRAHRESA